MRDQRWWSLPVVVGLLGVSIGVGAAAAPAAVAAGGTPEPYQITFVARVCPTYTDIMANRARNNIQESLRDLGKDTVYTAGQPITPSIEAANDPNCHPLDGWQFAIGTGYTGKTPGTDYLSTITGDYGQTIQVKPKTPELDALGQDTGRVLKDAVTVTLTADQANRAQQSNRLWVQGGTKANPLLNNLFPGEFGFGALRCAIDNLNGDNVEWIGYPSGARHVFCYYYAVQPPPSAGTIVVRKQLQSGTNGPATFRYVGNISYTTSNDFFLTPPDDSTTVSQSFVRAAGDAWDFEEQPTSGYSLVSLTCAESLAGSTSSSWTITSAKAVVHVGDGATVTCTYVNAEVAPATGALTLNKVTYGGVGSFPFLVTRPDASTLAATATTTTEGNDVLVASTPSAPAGSWTARETLPASTSLGSWDVQSVQCNGATQAFSTSAGPSGTTYVTATRTIGGGETVDCTFANVFTPGGLIEIAKRTTGGVGTFSFPVVRLDQLDVDGAAGLFTAYGATVSSAGTVTDASPLSGHAALDHLPVGAGDASTYFLGELSPPETTTATWTPTAVTCTDIGGGGIVPITVYPDIRAVKLVLTSSHPRVRCIADNSLVPVGHLDVSKTIEGRDAGLQGSVAIAVSCGDGTTGSLTLPAGATGTTSLGSPLVTREATHCTVSESANGSSSAAPLTSTTFSANGATAVEATQVSVAVPSGQTSQVAVVDVYGGLAPSGASGSTALYALLGLLLTGTGGGLMLYGRRS
jgi:hypothetical protein